MIQYPRFKQFYRVEPLAPYGVLLLWERGQILLRGRAYILLAKLLDGRHTTGEIVRLLDGSLSEAETLYAIEVLRRKGHVVDDPARSGSASAAFWELLDVEPAVVVERKRTVSVAVRSTGDIDSAPLQDLLVSMGASVTEQAEFAVVVAEDYLDEGLDEHNREALSRQKPWMLVRPIGMEVWLGPLFVPGKTGCWACLAQRLKGHRKAEAFLRARGNCGPIVTVRASLPSSVHAAYGIAATLAMQWLVTGASDSILGRVVTIDMATLERKEHLLTKRPQCPACGDPNLVRENQRNMVTLSSRPTSFREEGGYRSGSPSEMLAKFEHHVSPITGIVSHIAKSLALKGSPLTPSYVADHNFAHIDESLFFVREGQRARSGGKGKSDAQARASALAESIERYSGVFFGEEERISARLADLEGAAIHPNAFMLFSDRQYAEREKWCARGSRFARVPEPFDPDALIDWSPVFSILRKERRYLPTACCYFGYGNHHPSPFAKADSNGCAAGTCKEEAIFQGILELCERDATAIWWYNRLRLPAVDLASFGDAYYGELQAYYESIHRSFCVIDITNDLGIPTFAAVSHRTDKKAQDIILGLGAHLDPKIALLRAATELNQFLPAVFGVGSDPGSDGYMWSDDGIQFWKSATVETDPYLTPDPSAPKRVLSDFPSICNGDLREDILFCARAVEELGIETFVLDQTRPDTGLHVVRVVAPGLRHFWARYAPGRLYDVPVKLGRRSEPIDEGELNPYPIFF